MDRQADRQTDRQTDKQTDRQTNRQTDRQTENSDFIGPFLDQGSKKSNLEHSKTLFEREKIIVN